MSQSTYWLLAVVLSALSVAISIATFVRNRPDRVKEAIKSALEPVRQQLEKIEGTQERQGEQISSLSQHIAAIENEQSHALRTEHLGRIHERVDQLVIQVSRNEGANGVVTQVLDRMQQLLMNLNNK